MKQQFRILLALTVIFTLNFQNTIAQKANLDDVLEVYRPLVEEVGFGVAAYTQINGEIEQAAIGFADGAKNPLTSDMKFNIGSCTKTMTAILILQEMEKGNILLEDPISKFLEPINNVQGDITILQLLKHKTGLGELVGANAMELFFEQGDSLFRGDFLMQIPEPDTIPGIAHVYTNTNYLLLGKVLEAATQRQYFDLLRERIFEPCGMINTSPYVHKNQENLAHPMVQGVDEIEKLNYRFFADFAWSAGSVCSNLEDMLAFDAHLFLKGTLLNAESLALMMDEGEDNYGLGMYAAERDSVEYFGHGGDNLGYTFRHFYDPQTNDIVLLFGNKYNFPFKKLIGKDILAYQQGKAGREISKDFVSEFTPHIGKYDSEEIPLVFGFETSEKLVYLNVQGQDVPMVSVEANKIYNDSYGIEIEFNNEKTEELIFRQNGMEMVIKRLQ